MRIQRLILGAAFLCLAAPAGAWAQAQIPASSLPPGDGRDLLAVACTQCHGLGTIVSMRDGEGGWTLHVHNMVLRGAQLSSSEAKTVVSYLTTNYGPDASQSAARAASAGLPAGAGKELVETRCTACHDLARVTALKRPQHDWDAIVANMIARGAPASADEGKRISAYLGGQFGKN
jgi:cytochrome c5